MADFQRQVRAEVNRIVKTVTASVPLTAKGEQLRSDVSKRITEIERTLKAEIPVDPEGAANFRRKLAEMVRETSRTVHANVRLDVDRSGLSRVSSFFRRIFKLGDDAGGTFTSIANAAESTGGVLSRFFGSGASGASSFGSSMSSAGGTSASAIASVGSAALSTSLQVTAMSVGLGLLAGAALAAGGAVTAAVAGLPVVLATAAAPIAAIALGFDGITAAAGVLKPQVDDLTKALNGLAENVFRPVFEDLKPVFPILQRGLEAVTVSTAAFAHRLVDVATSKEGLRDVELAIRGSWQVLDLAAPSAQRLFKVLLDIAGTSELYRVFGETIAGLIDRFSAFFENLQKGSLLTEALTQLRDVLFSATDAVLALADGAVRFFNQAGPGLTAFFDGLKTAIMNIPFEAFGASFGNILRSIGEGLAEIPPDTWAKLAIAVQYFASTVQDLIDSGALNALVGLFTQIVLSAGYLTEAFATITGPISSLLESMGLIGPQSDTVNAKFDEMNAKTQETGGYFDQLAAKLGENTDTIGQKAVATGGFFDDLAEKISGSTEIVKAKSGEMSDAFNINMDAIPPKAQSTTSSTLSIISSGFGTMAGTMIRISAEGVQGSLNWLKQLPEQTKIHSANTAMSLISGFQTMKDRSVSLAGDITRDTVAKIREIPDKLRDLGSILEGIGSAMMQGLLNGITNKARDIAAAAVRVVVEAKDAAERAIRRGSPSLVWRDMGVDTIRGYILGLRDQLQPLLETVRDMLMRTAQAAQSHRIEPLVQAEDGSFVPASFYKPNSGGTRDVSTILAEAQARAREREERDSFVAQMTAALGQVLNNAQLTARGEDLVLAYQQAVHRFERR